MEVILPRKTRFRQQRIFKLKIFIVFVLAITVLLCGLLAVDLNKCYTIYGETRLEMVQIEAVDNNIYEISILNNKYTLNLKYLRRDINNLKGLFEKII